MKNAIFQTMGKLLELSVLELEYQHRIKSNPFGEKWLNSRRTRYRIKTLKHFLYENIKKFLNSDYSRQFYEITLKPYFKIPYGELMEEISRSNADEEMDYFYRSIFYRLSLDQLFILMTNLLNFEHIKYPKLLESILCKEAECNKKISTDKILRYYIRFLDILSSPSILSLFDLDALKHTLEQDEREFSSKPLEELHLFTDWPNVNKTPFDERFPEFRSKLTKKNILIYE